MKDYDRIRTVTFRRGHQGNPMTRIDGAVCFPDPRDERSSLVEVGQKWEVKISRRVTTARVWYLELIREVEKEHPKSD